MNREETAALLTIIARQENRSTDPSEVHVWHYQIGDMRFEDCCAAVGQLASQGHRGRIGVRDLRRAVKSLRGRRVAVSDFPEPPEVDPDNVSAYNAALRRRLADVANGMDVGRALAAPAPPPPEIRHRDGRDDTAVAAMRVPCPWCKQPPGQRCVQPHNGRPLIRTPVHWARRDAAREVKA